MKLKNIIKEKLKEKDYLIGAFVASCNANNVEILAINGFDFVVLDMEHSPLGLESMVDMIRAGECYGMASIPRTYTIETKLMRRILDIGAHGLLVPMVNTLEDTEYIVNAVKFPPLGKRGMNAGRGPRWGGYDDYVGNANDALFTMVQCETKESVDNIEKIASVEGIDSIFIGVGDLSLDMGYRKEPSHTKVEEAISKVLDACRKHGKIPGIVTSTQEEAVKRIKQGFKIITVLNDLGMFKKETEKVIKEINMMAD